MVRAVIAATSYTFLVALPLGLVAKLVRRLVYRRGRAGLNLGLRKRYWVWTGPAVTLLMVVGFASIRPGSGTAPAVATTPAERIIEAGVARIIEESRRPLPPPAAETAPMGQGSAAALIGGHAQDVAKPTPPDGYSFVEHFGEMAKARMASATGGAFSDAGRPDWLDSPRGLSELTRQAADAGRNWAFGWIRLAANARRADLDRALEGTQGRIVGISGRMMRARLPTDASRLAEIAALAAVDGLGAAPREVKLAAFAKEPVGDLPGPVPVYVTLMAHDADGRWRQAMTRLGVVVGSYDPALRTYRASADAARIGSLAAADFVLAVEPIPLVESAHDTAVPAMGADAMRTHAESPGDFVGSVGASVPIAVMDTGLNINHLDIVSNRDSICGANFADNSGWFGADGPLVEAEDLWIDSNGHGTHVTGTVAGNGFVERRFAGMAPGVRHIRFAKVLDSYGFGFGDSIVRGMDFLATESGCSEAGRMSARVKPLIVNMSLAASSRVFEGRDVGARKLDSTVWSHRQLYVVAQSNEGASGFSNYGAAKNSLAVGAATDSGEIASFSSHGPTADGRLAPNVVGTGVRVYSAQGGGHRGKYVAYDGTSMASPAVAGIATLLMDAVSAHKEHPALTRARLMASAIRPDPWLNDGAGFPRDNTTGPGPLQAKYGMGKVSARTAALNRNTSKGWRSGSATTELEDDEYAFHDIDVPAGASRLDVVMTWDEPPADAVASTVLNDLDLWLDRDADCETEACGEHSSESRIDNVEWIVVTKPAPGTYRVKVLAHRVYTAAPRAAIAWTVIRGASTPTLAVEADRQHIEGTGERELTLTLTTDGYVAAGTRLHVDCRADGQTTCNNLVTIKYVSLTRADGVSLDDFEGEMQVPVPSGYGWPTRPINLGASIPIGEVAAGDERKVRVGVSIAAGDAADGARLYFTASAWNGRSGSVSVGLGGAQATPAMARPVNDDFAVATRISGQEGSETLDLLHATAEPGEPLFEPLRGRPVGSVWYIWTAPTDGPFRFATPVLAEDYIDWDGVARYDRVQVFQGDHVSALVEVASSLWQVSLFAEKGQTYRIRIASSSRGAAMKLRWSPGGRPVNDDFADAILLEGELGEVDGSSAGATLEPGESFGRLTATTWFRWTAPSDGLWGFQAHGGFPLVFEGDGIPVLRLVSDQPGSHAKLQAGAGREYRIAVAETDHGGLGGEYSLRWFRIEGYDHGGDAFAGAQSINGDASSEQVIDVDADATVEPGEPVESGVRTKWWSWEAPEGGLYTWRIGDVGEVVPTYPKLRVAMFTGAELEHLQLVAATGPGAPFEFLLDVTGGERYWISTGFGDRHSAAYDMWEASAKLSWGATPDNDNVVGAVSISGASGSASGSNAFATGARGERSDILGRSTLWWTYEASASGWVRFAVDGEGGPWALTVQLDSGDGSGGLEVLASDRWQRSENEVLFEARAGVRYTIALGVRGGGQGGEFTLRWGKVEDPGWLRVAGRLMDGDRDSRGNPVEIRGPGDLAVDDGGGALYLASGIGLQVFERDAATGRLDHVEFIETDFDLSVAALIWDPRRDRLLATVCGTWWSFARDGDGPALEDSGELTAADDPGGCAQHREHLLLDAEGANIYRARRSRIDHFAVEDDDTLRFVSRVEPIEGVLRAVLSNDEQRVYVAASNELRVYERDAASGELGETDFRETISAPYTPPVPLAITDDDAYLFAFDDDGERANLFSLEHPSNPDRLATFRRYEEPHQLNSCRFADARSEAVAVDVFCPGMAFAVRRDAETGQLELTDSLIEGRANRFNDLVPNFGAPRYRAPEGFAVSPDDRYVYLSTPEHGIVIFGRGFQPGDPDGPDLAVGLPSVDNAAPDGGATFTLTATVRNQGSSESPATTLRVYRSTDKSISRGDTEEATAAVASIAISGESGHSVELTAPSEAGAYYYGACVDAVPGESETGNNCSAAVTLRVADEAPDLVVESPRVDDDTPGAGESFTFRASVRNRGDARSDATTLRYYRSSDSTVSSSDTEVGTDYVRRLSAGADSGESISLAAPSSGIHYYGACVDSVPGESNTGNNCSDGLRIEVVDDGGSGGTQYEEGDTITTLPTGSWIPDRLSGASFTSSGGKVTITFDDGGLIEEGDYRYTCGNAAGCEVEDRVVQKGTITESSI